MARAVVESVAENTVDAIVAPVVWAVAFGAPGTFAYRAVNTLDAMVGHRSERYLRFGWASARADDFANWLPARLTALLAMAARPRSATSAWLAVRNGAHHHPSPNAGVAEAAFAGALGLQIGGDSTYDGRFEHRPLLGEGRPVEATDIERAVALSRDVSLLLAGALALAWPLIASRDQDRMTGLLPPPGEHGGDAAAIARSLGVRQSDLLDLSTSLNPFAPDLRPVLHRAVERGVCGAYPDEGPALAALASAIGIAPERLVLTNGGRRRSRSWPHSSVGVGSRSPTSRSIARAIPVLDPGGPVFRSNPHNPSGLLAPDDANAGVWDEAFYPLATGKWTRGDAERPSRSIVVGSLTKLLSCPGLRSGLRHLSR